jgi:hypothetical protein
MGVAVHLLANLFNMVLVGGSSTPTLASRIFKWVLEELMAPLLPPLRARVEIHNQQLSGFSPAMTALIVLYPVKACLSPAVQCAH